MNIIEISTPDELHQAIGEFLQSDYSREDLIVIYEETRKCANRFRVTYSTLPKVPTYNNDPLDGLQEIGEWCDKSIKLVDDIVSDLNQQTINVTIRQLKKLKGSADSVRSLVDTKLKEQAQKEARAKVEKEYKKLDEEASKTKGMLLIQQEEVVMKLEQEAQAILRRETEDAVQIYLSKDPTFKNRISQQDNEINKVLERLNELIGTDTPTGKLLDIYCKLKNIPLQKQFDDVGYAYSPIDDWADVICRGCNRLYTSIDNVIETFEEIQTKAKLKTDGMQPQKKTTVSSETGQENLQKIIEALKNLQKSKKTDKDIKEAKSALPPIEETYDIICRSKEKCGAKTTNVISWLGSAARDGSEYYQALLHALINPEVIADLETWQEKIELGQIEKESDGNIIFISHAAEDKCVAEEVKRQIENVFGDKVSVFVSSITIEPGDDWFERIVESLMNVDALLVIFTPVSEARPFVWFEIGFSWLRKLKGCCEIYPLCVPPIDPGSLPEPVCRLQGMSLANENKLKSLFEKLEFQFGAGDLKKLDQGAMAKCFPEYPKEVLKDAETDVMARKKRMQELIAEKRVPACNEALQIVSSLRGLLVQDTIEGSLAFMRGHDEWFEKNTAFLPYEFSDRWVSMKLNLRKAEMMSNAQEKMQDGPKRIGMIGEIVGIQAFTDELANEAERAIREELGLPPVTIHQPKKQVHDKDK